MRATCSPRLPGRGAGGEGDLLPSPTGRGAGGEGEGNSFIPRLWARMHLDTLLEQGSSQAIKDEIIALSEEYHIITPYTSLLVLETDADRERFGVKRRFQMRDGEKFFATGRENANWELIQQQMKRAGTWRLGLRREVLQQFSLLGRDIPVIRAAPWDSWEMGGDTVDSNGGLTGMGMLAFSNGGATTIYNGTLQLDNGGSTHGVLNLNSINAIGVPASLTKTGAGVQGLFSDVVDLNATGDGMQWLTSDVLNMTYDPATDDFSALTNYKAVAGTNWSAFTNYKAMGGGAGNLGELNGGEGPPEKPFVMGAIPEPDQPDDLVQGTPLSAPFATNLALVVSRDVAVPTWATLPEDPAIVYPDAETWVALTERRRESLGLVVEGKFDKHAKYPFADLVLPGTDYSWFNSLFAPLPPPPVEPQGPRQPWPAEARKIARSLLRTEHLTGVKEGLEVEIRDEWFDARWDALTFRAQTRAIVSPQGWLSVSSGDGAQATLSWADAKECGSLAAATLLGRVRASQPADLREPPLDLGFAVTSPLDLACAGYSVQLDPKGEHETLLVLKHPNSPQDEIRILVDTTRHVVMKVENVGEGKVNSTMTFDDFVEIAGAWYAGRIESLDSEGRRVAVVMRKFTVLPAGQFDRLWKQEMAIRDRAQLLRQPLPRLVDAKKALAAGKATFEDQMLMLLHFQGTQQWDRVLGHLAEAEKLSGKAGMRWVRLALLPMARKAEEAKKRCFEEAESLANTLSPQPSPGGRGGSQDSLARRERGRG